MENQIFVVYYREYKRLGYPIMNNVSIYSINVITYSIVM